MEDAQALRGMFRHLLAVCLLAVAAVHASAQDAWQSITPGTVVLFRHATAPGVGDPAGFKLNDCRTQRNLSAEGQAQAQRIGAAFQQRGIEVSAVWSSQWCRARETANLAFPGKRVDQPLFNSFFVTPEEGASQTQAALDLMASRKGQGVTVVVTHQVNITALTGVVPASGEGVVIALRGRELKVLGRVKP
ncbi:MAG TPA: histidine phosphatase family protein [Rhodoferax sp.]|nr:histidine phosphatase family protein [Rhodoferax sp.]